jgi:preflagellin peptidase FlaK
VQQTILEWARTIVALAFLFYASWSDYKTREVSNRVWALFAPVAFALTFCELYVFDFSKLSFYGLCFGLTVIFAVALFYSGGFGGADSKALMCLALAIPFVPANLPKLPHLEISPISQIFFPVTIFSNSVLLAAFTAVIIFLYNIIWRLKTGNRLFEGDHRSESLGKKILVLVTAYKVPIDKLKEKWHIYPLEDIEENVEKGATRKLIVVPRDEGRTATVERLDKAVRAGAIQDRIWASPGLPMLIFVTAGLITALLFGDIVWICVRFLLR